MNKRKVLLFVGLAGLGYTALRVWRLSGAHVTTDPTSAVVSFNSALKSQAFAPVPLGAAGVLLYLAVTR